MTRAEISLAVNSPYSATMVVPSTDLGGGRTLHRQIHSQPAEHHPYQDHHPYRLEVGGVTPVSVFFLWSVRPQPLSAIPHTTKSTRTDISKANVPRKANNSSHRSATEHVTATRGPNRKVTKVTVRNNSPVKHSSTSKGLVRQSHQFQKNQTDDWQSDGVVTPLEEDDIHALDDIDHVKTAEVHHDIDTAPIEAVSDYTSTEKAFENGVSIQVNGIPWSHVVVGDAGDVGEAFIVVYGLHPNREYEMILNVEGSVSNVFVSTSERGKSPVDILS